VPEDHIFFYGTDHNWWSRSGAPDVMPVGEIGGPDSEIFYEFDVPHDPKFGKFCHPNCGCGKFLEIGNSVFIQYKKLKNGKLEELPQKNVDFGGGLERIAMAVNNSPDMFSIDMFTGIIKKVETDTGTKYGTDSNKDKSFRVIADHLRASVNLLAEGIIPANKLQGYVLRRLVRRAMFHFHLLGSGISGGSVSHVAEDLKKFYPNVEKNWDFIEENLNAEATRFESALKRGLAKLTKAVNDNIEINGQFAFDLYQTEGFPLELTMEILKQNGMVFTNVEKNAFTTEFEKHRELSRTTSAGMFKGGLENKSDAEVTKLHTATHLLHAALREILGEHVSQKGSHITTERLRFDFSHPNKLTEIEIEEVEKLINGKIKEDLPVGFEEMSLDEAIKGGALHFFGERYGETVKVYSVGSFSKEVCGGPHVKRTGELGRAKIIKQEKIGSGIVRVYLALV
jgi:alanyl-tRNA synthetase